MIPARASRLVLTLAAGLLAVPRVSLAESVIWETQTLRHPVAVADARPTPPHVPDAVPAVRGAVDVGPGQAAVIWLEPATVIRVRVLEGDTALELGRVVGSAPGARAIVAEPGIRPVSGDRGDIWYLAQPAGRGDLWFINAAAPARVIAERPALRTGRLIWEEVHDAILSWIDGGGPMPAVPAAPGSEALETTLRVDEALAGAILRAYPGQRALGQAVAAWRKASALVAMSAARPALRPYMVRQRIDGAWGTGEVRLRRDGDDRDGAAAAPYRSIPAAEAQWDVTLTGPGILHVEARAVLDDERAAADQEIFLEVGTEQAILGRVRGPSAPASRDTAAPWLRAHPVTRPLRAGAHPVSLRHELVVPLIEGEHTYRVAVHGGPFVVRASVLTRRARLAETLRARAQPGDFIRRAEAHLGELGPAHAPAQALVRALLDELVTPVPRPGREVTALPPLLELAALRGLTRQRTMSRARSAALSRRVRARLDALPRVASHGDNLLAWHLRIQFARAFARWRGSTHAARFFAAGAASPESAPAPLLGEVASLDAEASLPRAGAWLRAAEDAWRDRPYQADRRRNYISIWHRTTRWSLLAPVVRDHGDPGEPRSTPFTWLDTEAAGQGCGDAGAPRRVSSRGATELVYAPIGVDCQLDVPAAPADPGRPARLRVRLFTPDDQPGPVEIRVGDAVFGALAFEREEVLELAVPPGPHRLRVDGPASTVALVELPAPAEPRPRQGGLIRRRWPLRLADGASVRYHLPDHSVGGALRVELREVVDARAPRPRRPVAVRIRSDAGWTTRIHFTPGPVDSDMMPLDAPAGLTSAARFVVWLPAGTRRVWLETDDDRMLVTALAVRQDAGRGGKPDFQPHGESGEESDDELDLQPDEALDIQPDGAPEVSCPAPPLAVESPLIARLYALSRCLIDHPEHAAWRIERAGLLLDLGRQDLARADLRALSDLDPGDLARVRAAHQALEERVRDSRRASHLLPQPRPALFAAPTAIAPALLALRVPAAELAPWLELAQRARARGASSALEHMDHDRRGDPVAAAIHARLSQLSGRHHDAADALLGAYVATDTWQLGLDALDAFGQVLLHDPDRADTTASLAHGLATRLGTLVEHTTVRRVLGLAARRSRLQPLRGVDGHAGFERLYQGGARLEADAGELVPWAFVAPPWSEAENRMLSPGRGARITFELARPASVWVEAWCRSRSGRAQPCRITLRVDQRELAVATAAADQRDPLRLTPARLAPGPHTVEAIVDGDAGTLAAIRFMTDRPLGASRGGAPPDAHGVPVTFERPSRVYAARASAPVTLTVAGPLALRVDLRTRMDAPASTAVIAATPLGPGVPSAHTLALDLAPDPAMSGDPTRGLQVSQAVDTVLLLPEPGPYRVTVHPSEGVVLARFSSRRDVPAPPADAPDPAEAPDAPGLPAPAPLALIDERPSTGASSALWMIHAHAAPRPYGALTYSLLLGVGHDDFGAIDAPEPGEPRLDLELLLRQRRGRLWLGGDIWTRTRLELSPAAGVRLKAHRRRLPGQLRADVVIEGALQRNEDELARSARGRLRVDRAIALAPSLLLIPALSFELRHYSLRDVFLEAADPRVFSRYGRDHARGLTARASLYWRPLQDQAGILSTETRTNADLASLDHVAVRLAWRGVLELAPLSGPIVELSYRMSQRLADAHRVERYTRHDPGASLSWRLWEGHGGRLLLELRFVAFLALGQPDQHHFRAGLRYDFTRGRGLTDMFPADVHFADFEEPRPWSPPR